MRQAMIDQPQPYDFEYIPTRVLFGRGCVSQLNDVLADIDKSRVLVVTGSNVGANQAVMGPIKTGLDERLITVFDETTPEKRLSTVFDGVKLIRSNNIDIIIGVGGGSSLNVARAMCSIAPIDRPQSELRAEAHETSEVPSPGPEVPPLPNISIPTTMPGADISAGGSISVGPPEVPQTDDGGRRVDANITDTRTMPEANFYDPDLFATTPIGVLASSAMNGFDKGIETIYSREASPVSTAHSIRALQHYQRGLPKLVNAGSDGNAYDHAVVATQLVQYGRKTNIIHTFGNGVSFHYDVIQGAVHGIVAPHVLRYVFNHADARREQIAAGLSIDTTGLSDDEIADHIIEQVRHVSNALELPSQLRTIDQFERDAFDRVAEEILDNYKHGRNPPEINPTHEDIVSILNDAW